jgi:hypothetical protein
MMQLFFLLSVDESKKNSNNSKPFNIQMSELTKRLRIRVPLLRLQDDNLGKIKAIYGVRIMKIIFKK